MWHVVAATEKPESCRCENPNEVVPVLSLVERRGRGTCPPLSRPYLHEVSNDEEEKRGGGGSVGGGGGEER